MRNKKSSLSLSINAIVILILAITMLGLGLTFMRGLFKQATERVQSAVSAQELVNPPTVDNPMTIAPGKLTVRDKSGSVAKALIAFMNTGADKYCSLKVHMSDATSTLINPTDTVILPPIIYNNLVPTKVMAIDQINTWTLSVIGYQGVGAGNTDLFTAIMCCDETLAELPIATTKCGDVPANNNEFYKKDLIVTYTP